MSRTRVHARDVGWHGLVVDQYVCFPGCVMRRKVSAIAYTVSVIEPVSRDERTCCVVDGVVQRHPLRLACASDVVESDLALCIDWSR